MKFKVVKTYTMLPVSICEKINPSQILSDELTAAEAGNFIEVLHAEDSIQLCKNVFDSEKHPTVFFDHSGPMEELKWFIDRENGNGFEEVSEEEYLLFKGKKISGAQVLYQDLEIGRGI